MIKPATIESTNTKYGEPVRLLKSKLRTGMLCLFFLLSFSSIKYLPGMLIIQDVYTGLICLFLLIIYPYLILTGQHRPTRLELYGLLIIAVEPNVAAYMAYVEFKQPYLYGLLAQRELILIGCSAVLIFLHQRRVFFLEDLERAMLWLAWLSLISGALVNLLVDKSQLTDQAGFSTPGMDENGSIILETAFIVFGFFYYAFIDIGEGVRRGFKVYLSWGFLAYLVFVSGGRAGLIAVIFSYVYFALKGGGKQHRKTYLFKFLIAALIFIVVLYLVPLESVIHLRERFEDAINVVFTGEEGNDVSANARISEVLAATPYIEDNLLFGNGFISKQWQGGILEVMGYFHPSDIGLLGVLFEYGILGLVIFSVQIYFFWKYAKHLPIRIGNFHKLSNAIKGFMLYFLLTSITTGGYVFLVEKSFFCLALLYCINQVTKHCSA
jgi:hypothetical protein